MAKTITQLTAASSVASTDNMIVDQSGFTRKATVAQVMAGGAASLPAGTVISGSSASAALRVTQTGAGNALLVEDNTNPDSTPVVINADGQIISGTTTAFDAAAGLQITADSTSAPNANVMVQRCMDSGNATITLARTRGSLASKTAVQSGDSFGAVLFQGWNAAGALATGARILAACDGSLGASDMPGRLTFNTTASGGSGTGTERMRIDSAGNVGIGTTANAAAILDVSSTTKGFLPPRMTDAERDAISTPPAGLMVYNTTGGKLNFYNGTAWEVVTSA